MGVRFLQLSRSGETRREISLRPRTDRDEFFLVNLYDQEPGRVFQGLGGAITEAAAHVFFSMPEEKREQLLDCYFGGGADYRFLRVSLDSCDFSLGHYEAMSDPNDVDFASFSLKRDEQEIIPFIHLAEKKAGRPLPLLLSPWSPPAFMKTTGERNHGGSLKPEYREMWAEYICRYIEGYQAHGLTVRFVTVQNEPNATQIWDSCRYTPEEERQFVRDYLAPALRRHGLKTEIFIWDHNKERVYERAVEVIAPDTRELIAGVAFHFYTGDHFEALDLTARRFPEKTLMFTEGCMEFSRKDVGVDPWQHALRYAHEYIGDIAHGATLLLDWNLYLDQQGGPNHVKNFCSAPVMCDLNTKEITVNPSQRAIALISGAAAPGSVRIASSAWHPDIESVAFARENGGASVALLNRGLLELPVLAAWKGRIAECRLAPQSLTTLIFDSQGGEKP